MSGLIVLFAVLLPHVGVADWDYYPPEQIHITLGMTIHEITVTWLTWDNPIITNSAVRYGLSQDSMNSYATGKANVFTDGPPAHRNRTIHVATMTGLQSSTRYFYEVGDVKYGVSSVFSFKTAPSQEDLNAISPQRYLVYGDMGHTNPQTLTHIIFEGISNEVDMILHIGDFAYDMNTDNGTIGDKYMNDIQPIASQVPYLVAMGNHEVAFNFSHYTERFRGQPSNTGTVWSGNGIAPNNWWYSWDYGLVHFVTISTEIYFDFPFLIKRQYEWLKSDLAKAQANRGQVPWIVVQGHRPLYCTVSNDSSNYFCGNNAARVRDGLEDPTTKKLVFGVEDLLFEFGVDLYVCGHVHSYERLWDIYKHKTDHRTTNPTSTTYIVTGAAGNRENHEPFLIPQPTISAFRSNTYGYSRMHVYNSSHLHWQQVMCDDGQPPSEWGKVIDDVWIIQMNHGPFSLDRNENLNKTAVKTFKHTTYDIFDDGYKPRYNHAQQEDDVPPVPYLGDNKRMYAGLERVYF